jgi:hypothetical protein
MQVGIEISIQIRDFLFFNLLDRESIIKAIVLIPI